jgi:hypothetical protein
MQGGYTTIRDVPRPLRKLHIFLACHTQSGFPLYSSEDDPTDRQLKLVCHPKLPQVDIKAHLWECQQMKFLLLFACAVVETQPPAACRQLPNTTR